MADPPTYPPGAAATLPVTTLSQAELLAILDRILPQESYLETIRDIGPGYEIFQGMAKMMERVSTAVGRAESGALILAALAGVRSVVEVEFIRAGAGAGAVTVKTGTLVKTSVGGRVYETIEDAVFGGAALGPIAVQARAIADGYEYDVTGQVVTAAGETIQGEIDTVERPFQDPAFGDPTIRVRQIAGASGGRAAALDALGDNRGIDRRSGEADLDYAGRIRTLPDTVSPDAIVRQLEQFWNPMGKTFEFIETFSETYQSCWDAPSAAIPGTSYDPNLFAFDDTRAGFQNRWLDEIDYRAAIIVVVPVLEAIEDVGMAYDDAAATVADHSVGLGTRSHSAYDNDPLGNAGMLQGGYDGFDLKKQAIYKELFDLLRRTVAGGVLVFVELEGE